MLSNEKQYTIYIRSTKESILTFQNSFIYLMPAGAAKLTDSFQITLA